MQSAQAHPPDASFELFFKDPSHVTGFDLLIKHLGTDIIAFVVSSSEPFGIPLTILPAPFAYEVTISIDYWVTPWVETSMPEGNQ